MTTPYDAAQRAQRQAADPSTSVFVTANAGSGKTKVLVDRIARLLLTGAPPDAFLCVTYTKAAAAEMQRRLFERLGGWCVMSDEKLGAELNALVGATLADPPLAQARALFARALETPGGLKIQTIHAFCERLLRRFPLEARVAPGFEIADEAQAEALAEQAFETALRDDDPQVRAALEFFARKLAFETFAELRLQLMRMRKAGAALTARDRASVLKDIANRHGGEQALDDLLAVTAAGFDATRYGAWIEALDGGGSSDRDRAQSLRAMIDPDADAESAVEAYWAAFLTAKGDVKKGPTKDCLKRAPWLDQAWTEEAARAFDVKRQALAIRNRDASQAAFIMLHAMTHAYQDAKSRAGLVDFDDLIGAARALLHDHAAAGWVLYKLDGGLDHILVDEGQDTSPEQWQVIGPLQDEFFAGDGARDDARTVFAVGDPKQSIYSFQGADPDRFLAESQNLASRAAAANRAFIAPAMQMSFRSAPEVLAAVDATFAALQFAGGPPGVFDRVVHDARRSDEVGLVEWWPLAQKPERAPSAPWDAPMDQERGDSAHAVLCAELARTVRGWIDSGEAVWATVDKRPVLRAMRPGDVLALVRSRGPLFQQLLKAFKQVGLPVAGADRMVLADDIAVQDMLALARAALDPSDDLSVACVLKSPLIGLTNDNTDLFVLAHGREAGESVFDRLCAREEQRFVAAAQFLRAMIEARSAHPHQFFSIALERLDGAGQSGMARMLARLGVAARDPLEEFMSRALSAGQRGHAHLHAFINAIATDGSEVKRQQDENGDAIAIMTVHGAKGLERPVVVLPQTAEAPKLSPSANLILRGDEIAILPRKDDDDAATEELRAAYEDSAMSEHLRLLYVAMTRARDRLIVCGYASGKSTEAHAKSWHVAVGSAMSGMAQAQRFETPFGEGVRLGQRLVAPLQDALHGDVVAAPAWIAQPVDAGSVRPTVRPSGAGVARSPRRDAQARFARGTLIHALLQRLPDVAPARRREAGLTWLARQASAQAFNVDALIDEALSVIDAPHFAPVFASGSRAEAPIAARLADGRLATGIVDRLCVTPTRCLVIDFKTERPPQDAAATPVRILRQMGIYREALMRIFPGRSVEAAIVWTQGPRLDVLNPEWLIGNDG